MASFFREVILHLYPTEADRKIVMEQLRPVSHFEKVAFPIMCTIVISLRIHEFLGYVCIIILHKIIKMQISYQDQ